MKRVFSLVLAMAMVLGLLPIPARAAGDGKRTLLDVSQGNIELGDGTVSGYAPDGTEITTYDPDGFILTGRSEEDAKKVSITGGSHKLTLRDLYIDVYHVDYAPAFNVHGKNLEITLEGDNYLASGDDYCGLNLNKGANLTITAQSTGTLTARAGYSFRVDLVGIGCRSDTTCGTVTIAGGRIDSTLGGSGCAGLTITGGRFPWGSVEGGTVLGYSVANGCRVAVDDDPEFPYYVAPQQYTVSFQPNGGSGSMESIPRVRGAFTLPESTFTPPEGKQFAGWATSATGSILSGASIEVNADTTLYAQWKDLAGIRTVLDVSQGYITIGENSVDGYGPDGTHITTVDPDGYILTGASNQDGKQVRILGGWHDIVLRDLKIDVSKTYYASAFTVESGTLYLTLEGENVLKSGADYCGMHLNNGASLTFMAGSGSLTARHGSGTGLVDIGSRKDGKCGAITIQAGRFNVRSLGGTEGNHGGVNIQGGSFTQGSVSSGTVCGNSVARNYRVVEDGGDYPYRVVSNTAYIVSFDPGEGSGTMEPVTNAADRWFLPECTFTAPKGKEFAGWATSPDGDILTGDTLYVDRDLTLHAVWRKTETKTIDIIEIGIPEPVVGETGVFHFTLPEKAGYEAAGAASYWIVSSRKPQSYQELRDEANTWYSDSKNLKPFAQGSYYTFLAAIRLKDGYALTEDTAATIAGASAGIRDQGNGSYYIYHTFTPRENGLNTQYYSITVTDGMAMNGSGTQVETARPGDTITIVANGAPANSVFLQWKVIGGDVTVAAPLQSRTTFTMPQGPVELKALYKADFFAGSQLSAAVDAATGQQRIAWVQSVGAVKYKLYRAETMNGDYKLIATTGQLNHMDSTAQVGRVYYYKAAAIDGEGLASEFSEIISAMRLLPQPVVQVSSETAGRVELTWDKVPGAASYAVLRSADGESWTQLALTQDTQLTDYSGTLGSLWYYSVQALDAQGEAHSVPTTRQQGIFRLEAPQITLAGSEELGRALITWEPVEGAKSYLVYRGIPGASQEEPFATVTVPSFLDSGAELGETYCYSVVALGAQDYLNSPRSQSLSWTTVLPCPRNLTCSIQSEAVLLRWEGVASAQGYEISWAEQEDGDYSLLATTEECRWEDAQIQLGETRFYRVRALADGENAHSCFSLVVSRTRVIGRPVLSAAQLSADSVKITWAKVPGAIKYGVYTSTDRESWVLRTTTKEPEFTYSGMTLGKGYYFRVQALAANYKANSEYSNAQYYLCTLPAPVISAAQDSQSGSPLITWEPLDQATGYDVYRSTNRTGSFKKLGQTAESRYLDTTAEAGTEYFYYVIALAEAAEGKSKASNTAVCPVALAAPVVTARDGAGETLGRPKLTWEAVDRAVEYAVYRASSEKGKYTLLGTNTDPYYYDYTGTPGKVYYYKVKALHENSGGDSDFSNIVSGIPALRQPKVTLGQNAQGQPQVKWEKVTGAAKYLVEYQGPGVAGWEILTTTKALSYTHKDAQVGGEYQYRITALAARAGLDSVACYTAAIRCILPAAKLAVKEDSATGYARLSWKAVKGALSYEVWRRPAFGGSEIKIGTLTDALACVDDSADAATRYTYWVKAVPENSQGASSSNTVTWTARLHKPGFRTPSAEPEYGALYWYAVNNAAGYEIYRSASKTGKYTCIATTDQVYWFDRDVAYAKTYFYKVKAIHADPAYSSMLSDSVSVTIPLGTPSLKGEVNDAGKPYLHWDKITGAVKYRLEVYDSGVWKELTTTKATSFTHKDVQVNIRYFYRLQAIAARPELNSDYSPEADVYSTYEKPRLTVSLDAETGYPLLTWKEVPGASYFSILRYCGEDYEWPGSSEGTSYLDTSAVPGNRYEYYVQTGDARSDAAALAYRLKAPEGLTVTSENGANKLSWNSVSKAASYEIYRAYSQGGKYTLIGTTTGRSWKDAEATGGKPAYYKLKAVHTDSGLSSLLGDAVSCTTTLAAPVLSVAHAQSGKPALTWAKVSGAKKYAIEVRTPGGAWTALASTGSLKYTHAKAEQGVTYEYRVTALAARAEQNSGLSNTAQLTCTLPLAKVTLTQDKATGQPKLSWKAVKGAAGYQVLRAENPQGPFTQVAATGERSFVDAAAVPGSRYWYVIRAVGSQEAAASVSAAVSIACKLLTPQSGIRNAGSGIRISWEAQSNAASYQVYRSAKKSGRYTLLVTTTQKNYTDYGVESGVTYYYQVKACHTDGALSSALSAALACTARLAAPQVNVEVNKDGLPVLTWNKVDGAAKYQVECLVDGAWQVLDTVKATTYTHKTAVPGLLYYYRVRALSATDSGDSDPSKDVMRPFSVGGAELLLP